MANERSVVIALIIATVLIGVLVAVSVSPGGTEQDPDVCIEVDVTAGTKVSEDRFRNVEQAFATADVDNRTFIEYRLNNTELPLDPRANFNYYFESYETFRDDSDCSYMLVTTHESQADRRVRVQNPVGRGSSYGQAIDHLVDHP
jgi:hypothetical protein